MKLIRRIFPFESDTMLITVVVWMCLLPLAGLVVVPVWGWTGGLIAAAALFVIALLVCWGLCGGKALKR